MSYSQILNEALKDLKISIAKNNLCSVVVYEEQIKAAARLAAHRVIPDDYIILATAVRDAGTTMTNIQLIENIIDIKQMMQMRIFEQVIIDLYPMFDKLIYEYNSTRM